MADCRTFEVDAVEHLIGGVVSTHDANEDDRSSRKGDELPRTTGDLWAIENDLPVFLVEADLDVVRVRALVAVPQQKPGIQNDVIIFSCLEDMFQFEKGKTIIIILFITT